jgi:hypothetical protein
MESVQRPQFAASKRHPSAAPLELVAAVIALAARRAGTATVTFLLLAESP